jgi:hypothetical protein
LGKSRWEDLEFGANPDKVSQALSQKQNIARCWWLTPVILAIQEAEIRRVVVRSSMRPYVEKP